jgi:hypothetical protein
MEFKLRLNENRRRTIAEQHSPAFRQCVRLEQPVHQRDLATAVDDDSRSLMLSDADSSRAFFESYVLSVMELHRNARLLGSDA